MIFVWLLFEYLNLSNSIITGINRPRIEKQNAPIKPINGEMVGTATANNTTAVTRTVLKIIHLQLFKC